MNESPEYWLGGCDEGHHSWQCLGEDEDGHKLYRCRYCGAHAEG